MKKIKIFESIMNLYADPEDIQSNVDKWIQSKNGSVNIIEHKSSIMLVATNYKSILVTILYEETTINDLL